MFTDSMFAILDGHKEIRPAARADTPATPQPTIGTHELPAATPIKPPAAAAVVENTAIGLSSPATLFDFRALAATM